MTNAAEVRSASGAPVTTPAESGPSPRMAAVAVTLAVLLVAIAAAVGGWLTATGSHLFLGAPPLFAQWLPHTGPGTVPVCALALVAIPLARRAGAVRSMPLLLGWAYLASLSWTFLLDAVDRSQRPFGAPLADPNEYLAELHRIGSVRGFLATFTDHILDFQPGSWTTHVSSHPPLATLFFWALARVGLAGPGWAGVAVILIGCTVAVSVPVTLRLLGAPAAARNVVPFLVFTPSAIWVGTSADGMFAGVAAAALAALAAAATRKNWWAAICLGVLGGLLAAATVFLSYGLAVLALPAAAVLVLTRPRHSRRSPWLAAWGAAVLALAAVFGLFAAAGFWWPEGLALLHTRYYQGIGAQRPYGYFVWANLAALVLSAGPGLAVSVSSALARRTALLRSPVAMLVLATGLALLVADLSGLSKAETERIWLPFVPWLISGIGLGVSGQSMVSCAAPWHVVRYGRFVAKTPSIGLLSRLAANAPGHRSRRPAIARHALVKGTMRWWLLSIQIVTALAVSHLLLTHW